jgi:uncharacterized DUF497 family protein
MTREEIDALFSGLEGFEWDPSKAISNLAKHSVDFDEAAGIFYGRLTVEPSTRNDEPRWIAVGAVNGRLLRVVFVRRGNRIRIISAMKARKNDDWAYRNS